MCQFTIVVLFTGHTVGQWDSILTAAGSRDWNPSSFPARWDPLNSGNGEDGSIWTVLRRQGLDALPNIPCNPWVIQKRAVAIEEYMVSRKWLFSLRSPLQKIDSYRPYAEYLHSARIRKRSLNKLMVIGHAVVVSCGYDLLWPHMATATAATLYYIHNQWKIIPPVTLRAWPVM